MKNKKRILLIIILFSCSKLWASYILLPMDDKQNNHLKAYGIAYYSLQNNIKVSWLLNYRGGSFLIKEYSQITNECSIRGVYFEIISDLQSTEILNSIALPEINQDIVEGDFTEEKDNNNHKKDN